MTGVIGELSVVGGFVKTETNETRSNETRGRGASIRGWLTIFSSSGRPTPTPTPKAVGATYFFCDPHPVAEMKSWAWRPVQQLIIVKNDSGPAVWLWCGDVGGGGMGW